MCQLHWSQKKKIKFKWWKKWRFDATFINNSFIFQSLYSIISIKGIVHPKRKFAGNLLTLRPSKMQMSLFLHQIWRNVALYHYGSAMDPLQWMGAVRMRVQTTDKNITVIHTTPDHLVKWKAACLYEINPLLRRFNLILLLLDQYKSSIHNIPF